MTSTLASPKAAPSRAIAPAPQDGARTPALDGFARYTAGMSSTDRRAAFLALTEPERAAVRAEKYAVDYLGKRGLSRATAEDAGLRVERIGIGRARAYGFGGQSNEAASCWGLFIPYPAFDRLRLIDPADLERFGGRGKYRGPAGSSQGLYDPHQWLPRRPELLLLIEGELNCLTVRQLLPECAAVGLPGKRSLKPELATQVAAALITDDPSQYPTVAVWVDRVDRDPQGFEKAIAGIARRLHEAGVQDVLVVPDTGADDANDLLVKLGSDRARRRVAGLLAQAEWDGPYEPQEQARPEVLARTSPRQLRVPDPNDRFREAKEELQELPAVDYLSKLYPGLEFDRAGFALCPHHEERTASFHAIGCGYFCHGCGQSGGNVYDAAGAAWGMDPSEPRDFVEMTDLLAAALLGRRAV
jgi:hypothetical protein